MTPQEFLDRLNRDGSDLSRWPLPAAREARLLLGQHRRLRERHAEMRMEALLAQPVGSPPAPWLAERIIARTRGLPQRRRFGWADWLGELTGGRTPAFGYAFALMLVFGILSGIGLPTLIDTPASDESASLAPLDLIDHAETLL